MSIKLWHDDVRPAPKGWTWVRTNDEARQVLLTQQVSEIQMDHDMGYDGPPPAACTNCYKGWVGDWTVGEGHQCEMCDGDGFVGGDIFYIAGTSEEDGYELVKWMVANNKVPPTVTIHSWNPAGADKMMKYLHEHGHRAAYKPFQLRK